MVGHVQPTGAVLTERGGRRSPVERRACSESGGHFVILTGPVGNCDSVVVQPGPLTRQTLRHPGNRAERRYFRFAFFLAPELRRPFG